MHSFSFHPKLLLRAPVRPINPEFTQETLIRLLDDPTFLEAIYVASPVLYAECCKWKEARGRVESNREIKLFRSLAKYYMRMTTRSTPFGLFSGCMIAEWRKEKNVLSKSVKFHRHTRLDMHCVCLLSEVICKMPAIKTKLFYVPNTSIYRLGKTIRYIEYAYHEGRRRYQISSVSLDPLLQDILKLSEDGVSYDELAKKVEKIGVNREQVDLYLDQLINSQVLVSNLEPAITDGDPLQYIITVLRELPGFADDTDLLALVSSIKEIAVMIRDMDKYPYNLISAYESILEKLTEFKIPLEQSKAFQIDLVAADDRYDLGADLQEKLLAAMEACEFLAEPFTNYRLKEFQQQFVNRYGTAEKSLLQVLDEECGIGYGGLNRETQIHNDENTHSEKKNQSHSLDWSRTSSLLFNKVIYAAKKGIKTIEIDLEELKTFGAARRMPLAPSMAVVFRCFMESDNSVKLQFERAYGSSALNIISRFAYADSDIADWCKEIAKTEEQINNEVCFVEVVHLPERRTGNILLHPRFRTSEVPYLARTSVEKKNRIDAADLMISVKNGSIILRDRRSSRQLVPRLSSAHNYGFHSLPLYWFLGDLQHQHLQPQLVFSWAPLDKILHFFPRVCYKGIVLSPATWKIPQRDYVDLYNDVSEIQQEKMRQFVDRFELPSVFLLSDGDNQLPVFTKNELSVMVFLDTIRNRSMIVLLEIPGTENEGFFSSEINFTKQFIASVIQSAPVYNGIKETTTGPEQAQPERSFMPASEWVYYKLYCGEKQADRLLISLIIPLIEEIRKKRLADKWFFIRYTDPDFHIRLRLHSSDSHCVQEIIAMVSEKLSGDDDVPLFWKLQLDTYMREIERYGAATITNAEIIFCIDSETVLYMLAHRQSETDSNFSYCWLLKAIDDMLEAFELALSAKQQLIQRIRESFAKEMNAGKEATKQLDAHYRLIRPGVESLLSGDTSSWPKELNDRLTKRFTDLKREAIRIKEILEQKDTGTCVDDLLSSFIHMSCNRVFASASRQQEFMVYDFLSRHYRSRLARTAAPAAILQQQ